MNKSKSAGTLISKEQAIRLIENSYNKKIQEIECKEKATQDIISRSELKQQKLKLRLDLQSSIQSELNNRKRISLEQKLEKCLKLKTERRREILREITEKNHKFSTIVQSRKKSIESEENKKQNEQLSVRKSREEQSNPQGLSLTSREESSRLLQKSSRNESLLERRDASTREAIEKFKEKKHKQEENRLLRLAEYLEQPGSTR